MTAPAIASAELVAELAELLLDTITIQQDSGSLTPPAGSPNWTTLHADVRCNAKLVTSDETRDEAHTVASTAFRIIADGWLSGVTTRMRAVYLGANYDILGVSRVGNLNLTRLVIERRAS